MTNKTWDVTYNIENIVPGKYNVHVVTLPKILFDETARNLPVKYKVKLTYCDKDGMEIIKDCGAFDSTRGTIDGNITVNDISNMIVATNIELPGSLNARSTSVKITISGNANYKKASIETSEMYLDYIYIEPVTATLRGDVNGDGEIGMPDVMFVVNYILGNPAETFNADAADANLDGEIGMPDVMFIVNYILNDKFPDEE